MSCQLGGTQGRCSQHVADWRSLVPASTKETDTVGGDVRYGRGSSFSVGRGHVRELPPCSFCMLLFRAVIILKYGSAPQWLATQRPANRSIFFYFRQ